MKLEPPFLLVLGGDYFSQWGMPGSGSHGTLDASSEVTYKAEARKVWRVRGQGAELVSGLFCNLSTPSVSLLPPVSPVLSTSPLWQPFWAQRLAGWFPMHSSPFHGFCSSGAQASPFHCYQKLSVVLCDV